MIVANVRNRHGGCSTSIRTPRASNACPIVIRATLIAGEVAGNV